MEDLMHWLSQYGLWVVFFGMIVEGTAVIILSGVLCHLGVLPCEKTYIVAVLGAIAGDQMWYFAGKFYAKKILDKFPNIKKRVEKLKDKIRSKGNILAFSSRFIYGGAVVIPLSLAIYDYPYKKFALFDAIGVSIASLLGLTIGYYLSDSYKSLIGSINNIEYLLLAIVIFFIVLNVFKAKSPKK